MAVSSTDTFSGPYEANGVTVAFPFTFKAVSVDDVAVIVRDADGVDDWINPSAYTVTLAAEGGTATFSAAPVSGSVYVISEPSFLQAIDFATGQPFLPSVVNEANDRAAVRTLYLKREIERAPRAPIGGGSAVGLFPRITEDGGWDFQEGTDSDPLLRQDLADPATGAGLVGFVDGETYDPDTVGKRVDQLDMASAPTGQAIQLRALAPADNGQRVELAKQDYPLIEPLRSGARAIEYQGAGMLATRLLVSTAHGAIEHGLIDTPVYFASLTIKNIGISAATSGVGNAQTAIKARFQKDGPGAYFENVRIGTFNAAFGFRKFIELTGATRTTMRSCRFQGNVFGNPAERAAGPQIGVHIISNNNADKSYEYVFDDVLAEFEVTAFLFECLGVAGDSGSVEGVTMTNVRGRTNMGPFIDFRTPNDGDAWRPPLFTITNGFNYQGTGAIAHFDGVETLTIENGWHAFDGAIPGSPSLNQIQLRNSHKVVIRNQTFRIFDQAHLQWVISIEAGCSDVLIENCTLVYEGSPVVSGGGFFVDASCPNVRLRNIIFIGWPSGLPQAIDSEGNVLVVGPVDATEGAYNLLQYPGAGKGNAAADSAALALGISRFSEILIPAIPAHWLFDPAVVNAALAARLSAGTYGLDIRGLGKPEVRPSAAGDYLIDLRGSAINIRGIRFSDPGNLTDAIINVYKTNPYEMSLESLEFINAPGGITIEHAEKLKVSGIRGINVPLLLHRRNVAASICVDSSFTDIRGDNCKLLWEGYKNEGLTWDGITMMTFDGDAMVIKQCLSCVIRDSILDAQYDPSETPGQGGRGLVLGGYADDGVNDLDISSVWLGAGKNALAHLWSDPASPISNVTLRDLTFACDAAAAGTIPYSMDLRGVNGLSIGPVTSIGVATTATRLTGSAQKFDGPWPWSVLALSNAGGGIIAGSGSLTSATATVRWKRLNGLIFFDADITITTAGSATGQLILIAGLPAPLYPDPIIAGGANDGAMNRAVINSDGNLFITRFDGGTPIVTGRTIKLSGVYAV